MKCYFQKCNQISVTNFDGNFFKHCKQTAENVTTAAQTEIIMLVNDCTLELGLDQNLHELSMNMILCFTICVKREHREWQFS